MANIKELKKRISATKNILKITSAMKLVSTSKIARSQSATLAAKLYNKALKETLDRMDKIDSYLANPPKSKNKNALIIVVSSDRGLCGSFNINIQKYVQEFIASKKDYSFKFYYVGKKAKDLLAKNKSCNFHRLFEANLKDRFIESLLNIVTALYKHGDIAEVYVIYTEFKSILNMTPTSKRILPLDFINEEVDQNTDYLYDVDKNELGQYLISLKLFSDLKLAILESELSSNAARMTAMDNASKNCSEMIKRLTIDMNKLRQSAITTELTEIVSGAESLKG